ncbi:hypothetical protein [Hugenholtzia roseola]|uniref:hypothetical protein n=1 Tax=Hugenholtzia roseola TaxID=1002 RepID=UPI000688F40B|nr:hypothetical protein [Hugenholtzia roseola]
MTTKFVLYLPLPKTATVFKAYNSNSKSLHTDVQPNEIKKQLLELCRQKQMEAVRAAKAAMDEAQESANEEDAGTEEKFESFRTQLQQDRDMFARHLVEAQAQMEVLLRISAYKENQSVSLGAVVETEVGDFFISISLGQVKMGERVFFAVSNQAPIFIAMANKKAGESFDFRGKKVKIKAIY